MMPDFSATSASSAHQGEINRRVRQARQEIQAALQEPMIPILLGDLSLLGASGEN
jgi:hypothetical protein